MNRIIKYTLIIPIIVLSSCFEDQEFNFPDEFSYVAFQSPEITAVEGETTEVSLTIIYSGPSLSSPLSVPVNIETTDGTNATAGVDYSISGESSSLTIPAGEAEASLTINILDNEDAVGPRALAFSAGSVDGLKTGYLGNEEGRSSVITILEDDLAEFAYTSFEEPTAGTVNNFPSQDGVEQVNVPGENPVDYTFAGGELGFNTSYVPGQEGGADSGLLFGVSKFTSDPDWEYDTGGFPDGVQAYSTSDADGLMEIVFDEVTIPEGTGILQVSSQLWFSDSSWEEDDEIDYFWRTEDGDELILSLRSNGESMTDAADGSGNVIAEQWTSFIAEVENIKTGSLVIQIGTDSGSEICFIDAISIKGI